MGHRKRRPATAVLNFGRSGANITAPLVVALGIALLSALRDRLAGRHAAAGGLQIPATVGRAVIVTVAAGGCDSALVSGRARVFMVPVASHDRMQQHAEEGDEFCRDQNHRFHKSGYRASLGNRLYRVRYDSPGQQHFLRCSIIFRSPASDQSVRSEQGEIVCQNRSWGAAL